MTLARSPHARHLRVLLVNGLSFDAGRFDGPTMREFAGSPYLADLLELRLPDHTMTADGLRALTEATFATSLRALWSGNCEGVGDRELARLADPEVFPNLKVVHLHGGGFADPAGLGERLQEWFGRAFHLQ